MTYHEHSDNLIWLLLALFFVKSFVFMYFENKRQENKKRKILFKLNNYISSIDTSDDL